MRQSMTGFASGQGTALSHRWSWELRGVNAKGLDLRLRVPDWIDGLEVGLRSALSRHIVRGNITLSVRVTTDGENGALALNTVQLHRVLDAVSVIEQQSMDRGMTLTPPTAADILSARGVMDTAQETPDIKALCDAMLADFAAVLDEFVTMRSSEGAALNTVLTRQLDEIARLTHSATTAAENRRDEQADRMGAALARVMENASDMDPARIAQELALIAVKSDITEELDRLQAHIDAARELLVQDGAIGRRFDFLMQEFNREANTLCAKSQSAPLTQIGLSLKTVIDQMREQVQNVE